MLRKIFITSFCAVLSCVSLAQSSVPGDGWHLATTDTIGYIGITLANGSIGLQADKNPLSIQSVVLNHVFDIADNQVSRIMQGINPFRLSLIVDGDTIRLQDMEQWSQTLDMKSATLTTSFVLPKKAKIRCTTTALRNVAYSGLIHLSILPLQNIKISVHTEISVPAQEYQTPQEEYRTIWGEGGRTDILRTQALSRGGKQRVCASSSFLYDTSCWKYQGNKEEASASLTARLVRGKETDVALVASTCSTRDFLDPVNESERRVVYMLHEGKEQLLNRHSQLWEELWQGDIEIEGDLKAQQQIRFALFNLYGSGSAGNRLSISPMGLSSQGYNGHIFWDAEMWMFPPLLLLQPTMARSMLDYRFDRLAAAQKRALSFGYKGAMFPWESDDAGEEATPTFALTGPFEHHITADVGIACFQYFQATQDTVWLAEQGYPLLREVAEFLASRVTRRSDGSYSICNVTGADEYANGVTDNAFTNGSAILALRYAIQAAAICNRPCPEIWKDIADNLRILTFEDGTLQEYEGYQGTTIKQADANLLAYPLELRTDPELIRQDLRYYENKIDQKNGPAMSYAIYAVQYARLQEPDKAYQMFLKSFVPHERPPFGVLAETPTSQNPYFMTGAGGLLQAVLYGFGGLTIDENGIRQLPSSLPSHWKSLTLKGIGPERKTFVCTH